MPLRQVKNPSSSGHVFDQLAREILRSRYKPGSMLPPERELATALQVNRPVVREALQRLQQVGLVEVGPAGARVIDYREHAGLDLLAILAGHPRNRAETALFWLSVMEVRAHLGVDVARTCAQRANRATRQEIQALSQQMREAPDDAALYALQLRFWRALHEGASNVVYRLAWNSLLNASAAMGDAVQSWAVREVRSNDYHRELSQAIVAGDAERAEQLAHEMLKGGVDNFRRSVQGEPPAAGSGEPASKKRRSADGTKRDRR